MLKPKEIVDLGDRELQALLRRVEEGKLDAGDLDLIRGILESYSYVTHLIDRKSTTIARLRQLLFGATTETTANVLGRADGESSTSPPGDGLAPASSGETGVLPGSLTGTPDPAANAKKKGHGRNGADDFPGATRVPVKHASLDPGHACPDCGCGKTYDMPSPGVLIRMCGQPPIQATIYELQKLRCNLCGKVFTADSPEGIGTEKYDASVATAIGVLKYGTGLPFHRLEKLQTSQGVPLPSSTQWELVQEASEKYQPVHEELIRQAAQGEVLHNDDTAVKILERMGKRAEKQAASPVVSAQPSPERIADHEITSAAISAEALPREAASVKDAGKSSRERKGLYTSGIVANRDGRRIAIFLSGHRHAGENLGEILKHRAAKLPPPIQMCDALSRNRPGEFPTLLANCLTHARRQFVDVHQQFPGECGHVLETLRRVYHHDAIAREQEMSADERLRFHQTESGPAMEELRAWLKRQVDEKLVERNSGLGAAIEYFRRHWEKLTLFLRVAGAPLDNNIVERALKKAILHRKNALFYLTQTGATVGDIHMSLIHTCELNGVNPWEYLSALQRNAARVEANPGRWLPWNYHEALAEKTVALATS